jgi:hypothetical protein
MIIEIGISEIFTCNDVIGDVRFNFNFVPCRNSLEFYDGTILILFDILYTEPHTSSPDQGLRAPVSPCCPYIQYHIYIVVYILFSDCLSCVNDLSPNLQRKIALPKTTGDCLYRRADKCIIIIMLL